MVTVTLPSATGLAIGLAFLCLLMVYIVVKFLVSIITG